MNDETLKAVYETHKLVNKRRKGYYLYLLEGKVHHNLPRKMDENSFRWLFGSLVSHLIDNLGEDHFFIEFEVNEKGKVCGSSTK